jgi:hypothetical protein
MNNEFKKYAKRNLHRHHVQTHENTKERRWLGERVWLAGIRERGTIKGKQLISLSIFPFTLTL